MLFLLISLAAWVSVLVLVVASCLLSAEGERHGVEACSPLEALAPLRSCERRARHGVQRRRARHGHSHSGARQLRAFPGR